MIENNLSWLQTMKQPKGYAGPVSHYWSDSLIYIGPGNDWRYEGLMAAYIKLFNKTKSRYFLDLAIQCGEFVVAGQKNDGSFLNSGFESNPSFHFSYMPHESAADISLLDLVLVLKKNGMLYKKYLIAAEKNLNKVHLKEFFDSKEKTFTQYDKKRALGVSNSFVPNKIATVCEAVIRYYNLTKNKKYLAIALAAAEKILLLQDKGEYFGGIYQENTKKKIITYYTARCIPLLLELHSITKDEKYLQAALDAGEFVKKMWCVKGFRFGFVSANTGGFMRCDMPFFAAGSADIIRALLLLKEKDVLKVSEKKYLNWVFSLQDKNGAFRSFYGLEAKNKPLKYNSFSSKPSWRDTLHVVGWNDKALRLLSELLDKDCHLKLIQQQTDELKIKCSDALYIENADKIVVKGDENYFFGKKDSFSNSNKLLKELVYSSYLNYGGAFRKLSGPVTKTIGAL